MQDVDGDQSERQAWAYPTHSVTDVDCSMAHHGETKTDDFGGPNHWLKSMVTVRTVLRCLLYRSCAHEWAT